MDYEKKYEELVGQIKKAHLYAQTDSTKAVLEDILSELKESEDEKIRKYILSCCEETIKANDRGLELSMETTIKLRDWLEKQGKSNPYSGVSFEYNGHTWGMCARDNGVEILVDGEIKERVYLFDMPQGKSALETLKEEKVDNQNCANPVVKVEPKFHKGDWVVDKEGHIFKIMRVDNCFNHITYACRFIDQKSVFWSSYSENDIRLWDITEDAKDGDVLCWDDSKCIALFKNIYDKESFNSYGFVGHCTGTFETRLSYHDIEGAHPATKEQRYFLFAKMREAGYEWDAEKKELKKIEQNPEWSEDDEGICRAIINDIANDKSMCTFDISKGICDKKINWLKFLKYRVQSRPKQEWSEEDEQIINLLIRIFEVAYPNTNYKTDIADKAIYSCEIVDWLKLLKERVACEANCTTTKQWKPSENELEVLRLVAEKDGTCLMGLYEKLKKLRDE